MEPINVSLINDNQVVHFSGRPVLVAKPDQRFNDITTLATRLSKAPIAVIVCKSGSQYIVKAKKGALLPNFDTAFPLSNCFANCKAVVEISDIANDERLANNSWFSASPNIRFFAAFPIIEKNGSVIGALCLLNVKPQKLTKQQQSSLRILAQQAASLLALSAEAANANTQLAYYYNKTQAFICIVNTNNEVIAYNRKMENAIFKGFGSRLKIGDSVVDYINALSLPNYHCYFKKAVAGHESQIEIDIPLGNTTCWCMVTFSPYRNKTKQIVGVSINALNISERKLAQLADEQSKAALIKSENSLRTIFENTNKGFALLDTKFRLVAFNQLMQRFSQDDLHETLANGDDAIAKFPADKREFIENILNKVVAGETISYETSYLQPNNTLRWYDVKYFPVANDQQLPSGIVMTLEDVTEQKRKDTELNNSLTLVTEQNKRLLNFSYIVSHNLRSHSSNIKLIARFLATEEDEVEKTEMIKHLKNVSDALENTLHDLNDVIDIQNNANISTVQISLRIEIDKVIGILTDQVMAKNASILVDVPHNIMVLYNPAYLESVLQNFISNAMKYCHPNRKPEVTILYQNETNELLISDNGIGIDLNKNGAKLFGLYKTFNGNPDARGIGLFISKNQIEVMGGRVSVESKLGVGTTFKIFFK